MKDLVEVVSKSDLDILLMRYGVRDILDVPQQENGISNHVANINGSNTPDLGKNAFECCRSDNNHFTVNRQM